MLAIISLKTVTILLTSKNIEVQNIEAYIFLVFLPMCRTYFTSRKVGKLQVFGNKELGEIFAPKKNEVRNLGHYHKQAIS
jgi:hypothetical protein